MEKVSLYQEVRPDIKISMLIYFNTEGQLIFDGYDVGKRVKEIHGDYDYEYTYTIEPAEVEKLYSLLEVENSDQHALLLEIQKRFQGNDAYSKFGRFMKEKGIDYSSFIWI